MSTNMITQPSTSTWIPIIAHQPVPADSCDACCEGCCTEYSDAAMVQLVLDLHRVDVGAMGSQFGDCVSEILATVS
jgi:hypothetical protein